MTSREQVRKEPTLADLEAFERLLRESLAKDQPHIMAPATTSHAALPVGKAANDSAPPAAEAPSADPLAELARMIEAPLDFGLPPLPPRQMRPETEPAAAAMLDAATSPPPDAPVEPVADQPAPFEPADFHGKNYAGTSGEILRNDPIDLDLLLGRAIAAPAMPAEPNAVQAAHLPDETAPAVAELRPIVAPLAPSPGAAELDPLAAFEEELRRFDLRLNEPRAAAAAVAPNPAAAGAWSEPAWQDAGASSLHPAAAPGTFDEPPASGMAHSLEQNEERLAAAAAAAAAATGAGRRGARRSSGVFFALGGIAVAGLAAIGATFAFSDRPQQIASGQVPVIAAKAEPAKEKPVNPGGVDIPNQNKQVLATRDAKPDTGPAQVVSTTEQPLDLREVTRREPVRVIAPSPFQSAPPAAASQPATPPAGETAAAPAPTIQPPTAVPAPAEPAPEARRVQSVRIGDPIVPQTTASVVPPAGTAAIAAGSAAIAAIASGATPARASTPAAAQPGPARPAATAPTTPPANVAALPSAPAAPLPPKVESRPDTAAPSAPRTNPPAPRPREATRPPAQRSANAPLNLNPPRPVRPTPAARPATAGGSFAVQLASRPSEAEAESASGQLRSRYAGQLDGRATRVVSGTANGQTVYRVRAGGYASLADANAACNRIKAAGGSCFPTRQ